MSVGRFDVQQPLQRVQATLSQRRVVQRDACRDHRLGEHGVGVGESRLEPRPVGVVRGRRDECCVVRQKFERLRMPGMDADDLGGTDRGERHRPRVGRPGLGGALELDHGQSAHHADVAVRRSGSEPPDLPAPVVVGGRLVGPPPRGVHPVTAATVVGLCFVQERQGLAGEAVHHAMRLGLPRGDHQHPGHVIGAVTVFATGFGQVGVLKSGAVVRHSHQMCEYRLWRERHAAAKRAATSRCARLT